MQVRRACLLPRRSPRIRKDAGALCRCRFSPGMESVISPTENSQELLSQLSPAILSLAAEVGLTPIPVRGKSQAGFAVTINGVSMVLWVGFYPGFSAKGVDYQVCITVDAKGTRWGVTRDGVKTFLSTGLIENGVPVARTGKDIKGLKQA